MKLSGKVAIVMGGTSSLGGAITRELAEQGATVVANSRDKGTTPELITELTGQGLSVEWVGGDLGSLDDIKKVVKHAVDRHGRIDILVVNAGSNKGVHGDLFEKLEPHHYRATAESQLFSRMDCLYAVKDTMIAQKYGKVVFVTTDAGRTPTPAESVIGAVAAGLMFFARAAGKELSRHGIRINVVSTTVTKDTPSYDIAMSGDRENMIARAFAKVESRTPFGMNVPADIAKAVLFFASEESDQTSGATISVNGGLSWGT